MGSDWSISRKTSCAGGDRTPPDDRLEALVRDLRAIDVTDANTEEDEPRESEHDQVAATLELIAERTDHLMQRPRPEAPSSATPKPDYEALWREERVRTAEAKRLRRLAAKVNRARAPYSASRPKA